MKRSIDLLRAFSKVDDTGLLFDTDRILEILSDDVFKNVVKFIKNESDIITNMDDFLDHFSLHQYESKNHLVELLDDQGLLDEDTNVVLMGCWYSILIGLLLSDKVKHIQGYDIDDEAISIGKNFLKDYKDNIELDTVDVIECNESRYENANLIINTSSEHMKPMNQWGTYNHIKAGTYFAFQSNNMFDIKDHVNCVHSLEEFKQQMPRNLKIILADEIDVPGWEYANGKRFTILGVKC